MLPEGVPKTMRFRNRFRSRLLHLRIDFGSILASHFDTHFRSGSTVSVSPQLCYFLDPPSRQTASIPRQFGGGFPPKGVETPWCGIRKFFKRKMEKELRHDSPRKASRDAPPIRRSCGRLEHADVPDAADRVGIDVGCRPAQGPQGPGGRPAGWNFVLFF